MSTVVLPSTAAGDCGDPRFEHDTLPHLDRLYAAAHRMTGAAASAEDLVERAFTRAYRAYRTSAPAAADPRIWLFRNLYSAWLDIVDEPVPAQRGAGSPVADAADAVRDAMDSLTPKVRFTVYLADVEGFSEAEIAEITGVPKGIAATRLHRAHGQLEARLETWSRTAAR